MTRLPRKIVLYTVRRSIAILSILIILFSSLSSAQAATVSMNAQGDCAGLQPKGASWTYWDGYAPLSWATVQAGIFWWNGSAWTQMGGGSDTRYGGVGNANVNIRPSYKKGAWYQASNHTASFVSGVVGLTYSFSCP